MFQGVIINSLKLKRHLEYRFFKGGIYNDLPIEK